MDELHQLKEQIEIIKVRNQKVEANKAWETSPFRIFSICLITYVTACVLLFLLDVKYFYLNAFVPVVGFFLSTLSLPPLKKWWIAKWINKTR